MRINSNKKKTIYIKIEIKFHYIYKTNFVYSKEEKKEKKLYVLMWKKKCSFHFVLNYQFYFGEFIKWKVNEKKIIIIIKKRNQRYVSYMYRI